MEFTIPYRDILDFWFGDSGGLEGETDNTRGWPPESLRRRWFKSSDAQDAEIAERFGDRVAAALRRDLVDWEREPGPRLALILLLDQFTRNIYRGTADAFAGDHHAATLTLEGLSTGMDRRLGWAGQVFFYMPLMHAEDAELQDRAVACYQDLHARVPAALKDDIANNLKFAEEHRDIIQRFGRFPHRNRVLERTDSAEELDFLQHARRYGQ